MTMKIFRKIKRDKVHATLTDHIAAYMDSRQRKLADWLNQKANGISGQNMRYLLITFCLVVGSYLMYILLQAFN